MARGCLGVDEKKVKEAVEVAGSIRGAALILDVSYTSLQWWIARNGYEVKKIAILVKRKPPKPVKKETGRA